MDAPPLQSAYEYYLCTHDDAALLRAIQAHGGNPPPEDVDAPLVHRINDIQLDGTWFRIVRVVSLPTGNTELRIYPTDCGSDNPGVPYSLIGERLLGWVSVPARKCRRIPGAVEQVWKLAIPVWLA